MSVAVAVAVAAAAAAACATEDVADSALKWTTARRRNWWKNSSDFVEVFEPFAVAAAVAVQEETGLSPLYQTVVKGAGRRMMMCRDSLATDQGIASRRRAWVCAGVAGKYSLDISDDVPRKVGRPRPCTAASQPR